MPQPPPPDNPVFQIVTVDYLVPGGARVSWTLQPHFIDPTPATYLFTLQESPSGVPTADDWVSIANIVNGFTLTDPTKRLFGKTNNLVYRIQLITTLGTYYSDTADVLGHLSYRDFRLAREILRKESLRHRLYTSIDGFFFKARRGGTVCDCTDPLTGDITNSYCAGCYGTGFVGGYYAPVASSFCDVSPEESREHRETEQGRGTVKDIAIQGRFLGTLPPIQGDVWINKSSDERYYMHSVKEEATLRSVPLIYTVELRLAPYTDPLFLLPRP